MLSFVVAIVLVAGASIGLMDAVFSAPTGRINAGENFNGTTFENSGDKTQKKLLDVLRWQITRDSSDWPEWIDREHQSGPVAARLEGLGVTFVNHSTFLIQVNGINILTDPIWSERASPVSFAGPKRVRAPGVALEDLPPVDLIVVSHNHYDHMDVETLAALKKSPRHDLKIIAGLGNGALFESQELGEYEELNWYQSVALKVGGKLIKITMVPAHHWSGRGLSDRNKSLWGGFILESGGRSVYFAGDSGYGMHFKEIGKKFPGLDLALLPIGAYEPRWFMKAQHMNPAEAVRAFVDVGAARGMGMHFGTFADLTDEAIDQPARELEAALNELELPLDKFIVPEFGLMYSF